MDINDIQPVIFDDFEIDSQLMPVTTDADERFKAFRALLIRRIEELAEKNMEKLMWILYRVDVSEKKLQAMLKETAPDNVGAVIADLIIERQLQKAESRKKFGEKENDWNFDI